MQLFFLDNRLQWWQFPEDLGNPLYKFYKLFLLFGLLLIHSGQGYATDLSQLSLDELMQQEVTGASKYAQKATEAPADVTVVTADDVHRYGWRTLADALRAVRSFYLTNDRTYQYIGIRGFSPPGDLNNRILFMIDGVRVNDSVYDSVMMGETFPLDIELVDRVEIVRGPGSAIYGGNAMFGVINVITRSGRDLDGTELAAGAASRKTYDGRVSAGKAVGDVEWLLSASHGNSSGGSYQFNDIAPGASTIPQADAEHWQRLFGKLSVDDWHASVVYGTRVKHVPTGSYGTIFDDPSHHEDDTFLLTDISKLHRIDDKQELFARIYTGQYHYLGQYPTNNTSIYYTDINNNSILDGRPYVIGDADVTGHWQGAEARWTSSAWSGQHWITGLEYTRSQDVYNYYETPPLLPLPGDNQYVQGNTGRLGVYTQDEIALTEQNHLTIGVRHDQSTGFKSRWSPRLAFVSQAAPATTYKILYGTAFRNPDFFANLNTYINYVLQSEQIQTLEGIWQHNFGENMTVIADIFENRVRNLIQQDANSVDVNSPLLTARGAELEWEARFKNDTRTRVSYSLQTTGQSGMTPDNSPSQMLKANISLPVITSWTAGLEEQALSSRYAGSRASSAGSYAVTNLSLGFRSPNGDWVVTGSVYNLFNRIYSDSVQVDSYIQSYYGITRSSLAQDGRLFRVKLETHF